MEERREGWKRAQCFREIAHHYITTNPIANDAQKFRPCHHREMLRKIPTGRPANLFAKKRNP